MRTETLNTEKQETPYRTETQNNEDRNITHPNTSKQTITQKSKKKKKNPELI